MGSQVANLRDISLCGVRTQCALFMSPSVDGRDGPPTLCTRSGARSISSYLAATLSLFLPKALSDSLISFLGTLIMMRKYVVMLSSRPPAHTTGGNIFYLFSFFFWWVGVWGCSSLTGNRIFVFFKVLYLGTYCSAGDLLSQPGRLIKVANTKCLALFYMLMCMY